MSDMAERLRRRALHHVAATAIELMEAAADEIERLQEELREAREAFEHISSLLPDDYSPMSIEGMPVAAPAPSSPSHSRRRIWTRL